MCSGYCSGSSSFHYRDWNRNGCIKKILNGNYSNLQVPGILALIAAIVSIVTKEGMYWYTRYYAKKIATFDIFKDAIDKMVDHSCDEETENQIRDCVMENENVLGIDLLQTCIFGNKIYVDVEIVADGSRTLQEAHNIADAVHDDIEQKKSNVQYKGRHKRKIVISVEELLNTSTSIQL